LYNVYEKNRHLRRLVGITASEYRPIGIPGGASPCGGADGRGGKIMPYCCAIGARGIDPITTSTGTYRSRAGPAGSTTIWELEDNTEYALLPR